MHAESASLWLTYLGPLESGNPDILQPPSEGFAAVTDESDTDSN